MVQSSRKDRLYPVHLKAMFVQVPHRHSTCEYQQLPSLTKAAQVVDHLIYPHEVSRGVEISNVVRYLVICQLQSFAHCVLCPEDPSDVLYDAHRRWTKVAVSWLQWLCWNSEAESLRLCALPSSC